MFTLKIFYFHYDSQVETLAKLKTDLYFVKLIMQKVSYIPLENILANDPLPRMSKKGWIFDRRGEAVSSQFLIILFQYQLRMSELPWLCSLVKHNVAAKHGNSKPLTSNELWLLELRITSTRILASIPDALWDMCKSSIGDSRISAIFLPTWDSIRGFPTIKITVICLVRMSLASTVIWAWR